MATRFYYFLFYFFIFIHCGISYAEPLRILIPQFSGPKPISKNVRTTIYFELSQAFGTREKLDKGAWLLYGSSELAQPTHNAAIYEATWASIRADLVLWGIVNDFSDGAVIQLFLTITRIIEERQARPEIWKIAATDSTNKQYNFSKSIPSLYYEFEPLKLDKNVILKFEDPKGIPLYKSKNSDEIIGYLGEIYWFLEFRDRAILVESNGKIGWLHLLNLSNQKNEALFFAQSVVQFFRGDWTGCINSLSDMLKNPNIPKSLRIDSLIYQGIALEKIGKSGSDNFVLAYSLNKLNKTAASYLLMSRISDLEKAKRYNNMAQIQEGIRRLKVLLMSTKVLFDQNEEWFNNIVVYSNMH